MEVRSGVSRNLSIRVKNLHLDYEIFEDRRAALRDRLVEHKGTGRRVVRALKGVSFDVYDGESVGIIGSNGSGKSTLLTAIAGLIYPTEGEILVSDEPKLLGVGATLLPAATGWRNIRIGCVALGMSLEEVEERMPEIGEFTGLGEALDRPLRTYSSGMRGRLHFAIATSVQPKILLIDEALAVGDFRFKKKSTQKVKEIVANAGTFLLVSHSLEEVAEQCPRVLWIEQGRLRADGPADEVIARYESFADSVKV
jgi:teichoic acid transport system ATP-binding protein